MDELIFSKEDSMHLLACAWWIQPPWTTTNAFPAIRLIRSRLLPLSRDRTTLTLETAFFSPCEGETRWGGHFTWCHPCLIWKQVLFLWHAPPGPIKSPLKKRCESTFFLRLWVGGAGGLIASLLGDGDGGNEARLTTEPFLLFFLLQVL